VGVYEPALDDESRGVPGGPVAARRGADVAEVLTCVLVVRRSLVVKIKVESWGRGGRLGAVARRRGASRGGCGIRRGARSRCAA
jgi:hypothetical protein